MGWIENASSGTKRSTVVAELIHLSCSWCFLFCQQCNLQLPPAVTGAQNIIWWVRSDVYCQNTLWYIHRLALSTKLFGVIFCANVSSKLQKCSNWETCNNVYGENKWDCARNNSSHLATVRARPTNPCDLSRYSICRPISYKKLQHRKAHLSLKSFRKTVSSLHGLWVFSINYVLYHYLIAVIFITILILIACYIHVSVNVLFKSHCTLLTTVYLKYYCI